MKDEKTFLIIERRRAKTVFDNIFIFNRIWGAAGAPNVYLINHLHVLPLKFDHFFKGESERRDFGT